MKQDCERCGETVRDEEGIEIDYVFVCDKCAKELGGTYNDVFTWIERQKADRERKRIGKCPYCDSEDTFSIKGGHYRGGSEGDLGTWYPEVFGCVTCHHEWYGV